jgi:putative N6-adenine-specific DNA methylase
VIVMNPPYGERIGDRAGMDHIYEALAGLRAAHPDWSLFLITSDKSVEEALGEADRRRKLYNGRLEACYYQYHGVK